MTKCRALTTARAPFGSTTRLQSDSVATVPRIATLPLTCIAVVALGSAVGWSQWQDHKRREQPDAAFAELTGRVLPRGVHASLYRSAIDDNFFRTGHYWILEGDTAQLREVLLGTRFTRSDVEAKWVAPGAAEALDTAISVDDVLEGYEWQRARNSWFLLLKDGNRAIYVQ
jgi:hypothetical protein